MREIVTSADADWRCNHHQAMGLRAKALIAGVLAVSLAATAQTASAATLAQRLDSQFNAAGGNGSAIAYDLTTHRSLWEHHADTPRTPGSVEKLLTTSASLLSLGANHRFITSAVTTKPIDRRGILHGNLFIVGGGDPTVGAQRITDLAKAARHAGLKRVTGFVLGDDGFFDGIRGVPAQGPGVDPYLEGSLGALVYDRYASATTAAIHFTESLRRAGVAVPGGHTRAGSAPRSLPRLARVGSPPISALIAHTLTYSDSYMAEMLMKGIGAERGGRGSTAAGLVVARARLAKLDVHSQMVDGSGLSYANSITPRNLVHLLRGLSNRPEFFSSLAIAGRSGTLWNRMRSGPAAGRCRAKTGTLTRISVLAGYCPAANGEMVAFALMMSGVDISNARFHQDQVATIIAGWHRP